jgi:hypothetical protein
MSSQPNRGRTTRPAAIFRVSGCTQRHGAYYAAGLQSKRHLFGRRDELGLYFQGRQLWPVCGNEVVGVGIPSAVAPGQAE